MDLMLVLAVMAFVILFGAWLALPASVASREPSRVSISRAPTGEALTSA